ncbi:MAG: hypothetical protein IKK42_08425 [Oscillospiraceae bacterium]|nr:hypothetical protein [Oscillospiraceae bacterium]
MKDFIKKHIVLFIGILLIIVFPDVMIGLGYYMIIAYSFRIGIWFLILNCITFILCRNRYKKQSDASEDWAIILSLAGGGIGSKLSTTIFKNKPSSDDIGLIYHYCFELNLFVFAVCPIFMIISSY